jgi:hypothetical protein
MQFLKDFINQAHTDNLKTKGLYPSSFGDFELRVSFGQGNPAKVPWLGFLASGMSISNGYYPVYLYFKEEAALVLAYGISETNDFGVSWGEQIIEAKDLVSQAIQNPPRYGDSYVFRKYSVQNKAGVWEIEKDGNAATSDELQMDIEELFSQYRKCLDIEVSDKSSDLSRGLFYMEKQLEDFKIRNWDETEFGEKYELIFQDGELKSQQYSTSIGPIDILAKDKNTGSHVVIELKRDQTSDDTVGQVARYMGWVKEELNDPDVRGIIVAGSFDQRLHYAGQMVPNVDVFLYQVDFKLSEYKK